MQERVTLPLCLLLFSLAWVVAQLWPVNPAGAPAPPAAQPASDADHRPPPVRELATGSGIAAAAAAVSLELPAPALEQVRIAERAARFPRETFADALAHEDVAMPAVVIAQVAARDPRLALRLTRSAPAELAPDLLVEVFSAWPQDDLDGAASQLSALVAALEARSPADPAARRSAELAAAAIAARWPPGEDDALLLWGSGLFVGEPIAAPDWLAQFVDPARFTGVGFIADATSDAVRGVAASYFAAHGSERQALDALALAPPGIPRCIAIYQFAEGVAERDPAAAVRFLAGHIGELADPSRPDEMLFEFEFFGARDLGGTLARSGLDWGSFPDLPVPLARALGISVPLEREAAWVATLPSDLERTRELAFSLGEQWAADDPAAASRWLRSLAPGPLRDHAIAGFVRTFSREQPPAALVWTGEIADRALRDRFLRVVERRWLDIDPQAARAALAGLQGEAETEAIHAPSDDGTVHPQPGLDRAR